MYYFLKTNLIVLISLIVFSCGRASVQTVYDPVEETKYQNYIHKISKAYGNLSSDVVIVDLQGGPITTLMDPSVNYFQIPIINPAIAVLKNSMLVSVHQDQTLHPELYTKKDITYDQAKINAEKSTKLAIDVIQYYKNMGKRVYVIGTSYGAFVATNTIVKINEEKLKQADGYLIVVGRLEMNDVVWKTFAKGKYMIFDDGTKPRAVTDVESAGMGNKDNPVESRNMARLAGALGYKRYTKLLANINMENVTYIYAKKDEQVGALTKPEYDFLVKKKAWVLPVPKAGHSGAQIALPQGLAYLLSKEIKK